MIGESGVSEKVLNLVYAQKLAALLEAEGYGVVMTRTTEEGLYDADASNKKAQDMQRRVAIIEEEAPVLTVSIHQNSYPEDSSVRGPQVFYYEQSVEGEKLATAIQDRLNEELEIERPRIQKGNTTYYILKRSVSTTVIVECGFLTNPAEEVLLQEETYQDRVAQAICDGILDYLRSALLSERAG
ncbi:MAG: N-acetylmuramoyl-L-alanine amidase [Lachnospiraceae bacterium]|nr:N-acetylmuramoyl-L-alanine amidase [Lachnospiraceae bacterium]